jgi:hypothetical protein
MTQSLCMKMLLRMLPLGYHIVISNGLSYTALRPFTKISCHVTGLVVGVVTLNTGISLDLQHRNSPNMNVTTWRWETCRYPSTNHYNGLLCCSQDFSSLCIETPDFGLGPRNTYGPWECRYKDVLLAKAVATRLSRAQIFCHRQYILGPPPPNIYQI